MNELTNGFFKTQFEKTDESVEKIGENMKAIFSNVKGVCK
jgi:hypothetical protein